jgi:YVTN family beta-propeller protein
MARTGNVAWTALFLLIAAGSAHGAAPGYHVVKQIPLGGDGGWDYLTVDAEARRLYIARSNRVMVVDLEKETVAGEIKNTPGVHGVAIAPKRGHGFTSNGRDSTVTVFDLKTLTEVERVKVGERPDAIIYDPATDRVFTFNAGTSDTTAIDAETNKVAGTIKLGGKPEFACSDEKGHVFVNIEDKNEVLALDARELKVLHRWPLAPGMEPTGLSIDCAKGRLFATCHSGHMVVLDAQTGKVIATPAIGKGTDASAFDAETGLAFSSNGDGTLTVVKENDKGEYVVEENVKTQPGARTMAFDPKSHNIYLAAAKSKAGQPRSIEPGSFAILVVGK